MTSLPDRPAGPCSHSRLQALFSWEDPFATTIVLCALGGLGGLILLLGCRPIVAFALFWIVRPPRLRTPTPPAPANLFKRLPCRGDKIM